jgi:hypothetical protein
LGQTPNELWCTDYKGEFLLGNRQYCYPLTVTGHASRFLLMCESLSCTRENYAFAAFERLFKERGLPANIRSDNGVPVPLTQTSATLKRELGLRDLVFFAITCVVSARWIPIAAHAGAASVTLWLLAALFFMEN